MIKTFCSTIMLICFATYSYAIDALPVTDSSSMQKSNAIFMSYWNADESNKFLCIVTVKRKAGDEKLPTKKLSIYKEKGQELIQTYEYQTPDNLISMYPLGEFGARFVTSWTGGSAHHFLVFALINDHIAKVIEFNSKLMPEFAWDKNGNEIILVTHLSWRTDKTGTHIQVPVSTDIYKWNAVKYEKIKDVPWQKRFEFVQKIIN